MLKINAEKYDLDMELKGSFRDLIMEMGHAVYSFLMNIAEHDKGEAFVMSVVIMNVCKDACEDIKGGHKNADSKASNEIKP